MFFIAFMLWRGDVIKVYFLDHCLGYFFTMRVFVTNLMPIKDLIGCLFKKRYIVFFLQKKKNESLNLSMITWTIIEDKLENTVTYYLLTCANL